MPLQKLYLHKTVQPLKLLEMSKYKVLTSTWATYFPAKQCSSIPTHNLPIPAQTPLPWTGLRHRDMCSMCHTGRRAV